MTMQEAKGQRAYQGKLVTPDEAVSAMRPGEVVFWACLAEPVTLTDAFVKQRERLRGTILVYDLPLRAYPWFSADFGDYFQVYDNYPGNFSRGPIANGVIQFVPWPLGITRNDRAADPARLHYFTKPDVYLLEMCEPDQDGWVSLGNYPWYSKQAIKNARLVIGEINPRLPRLTGKGARVRLSEIDYILPPSPTPAQLTAAQPPPAADELDAAQVIGAYAAELIHDGDTFQVGIGAGSEWVQDFLENKHDLGVHSEFITTKTVQLVRDGVITGARKNFHPGKVLFVGLGLVQPDPSIPETVEFVNEHPELFEFREFSYVASAQVVARNNNMVAIQSALSCDLTGQLVLNYLGTRPISGVGGNLDFSIGSHYSKGGRSIHCLLSTAKGGTVSRIVPQHPAGAIIDIPRTLVDYLATEHGVVNLEGRSPRQRAEAIISIAHPDFRGELKAAARQLDIL